MDKKITIQDIADSLGFSRNTVSKVLNNHVMPEATKNLVIEKAIQLGYKGYSYVSSYKNPTEHLNILVLAGKPLTNLDFFVTFIRGLENTVSKHDIDFFQYTYNKNTDFLQLHSYIKALNIDGIIAIELYQKELFESVLNLGIPMVFIDSTLALNKYDGNFDILLMKGREPIYMLANSLIKQGYNRFSYVGDYRHCIGFHDRFLGMRDALANIEHRLFLKDSLIFEDGAPYGDTKWLISKIRSLDNKPHVYFCANDSIAANVVKALNQMNIQIPKNAQVIGFDNTLDSSLSTPSITTVNVNKELLGQEALNTLLDRIKRDNVPSRTIYINTKIILRETTIKGLQLYNI